MVGSKTTDANKMWMASRHATNIRRYALGGQLDISGNVVTGVMAIAGHNAYLNGIAEAGTIGAYSGINTRPSFIGRWNNNGVAYGSFMGDILAVVFYKTTITAPQVALVSVAMAAL